MIYRSAQRDFFLMGLEEGLVWLGLAWEGAFKLGRSGDPKGWKEMGPDEEGNLTTSG
jgi:hypothetical protein